MSAPVIERPTAGGPRLGALIRAEFLRARSRRSLRWLTLLALLAVTGVAAIMFATTATVGQAELDRAADQFMAEQMQWYDECLADPGIPEDQRADACWKPTREDALSNAVWMLDKRPFDNSAMSGLLNLAGGLGLAVCLLIAASAGGAEWSARTMGLLFSWEPRRLRVFGVRMGVVVVVAVVIVAVLLAVALGLGALIAGQHGPDPGFVLGDGSSNDLGPADLSAAWELALRWLPLAGLAAAGAYAVAMATRSTGWAIGATIAFVLVAESVIQGLWAWGSQWLIQTNALAWLGGGVAWVVDRGASQQGYSNYELTDVVPLVGAGEIWISQARALGVLAAIVVVISVIAGVLLRRRDVD
ncbi:MAG: hypothetical protein WCF36_11505 [Candidatus Nanopelagicales bacterium]